MNIPRAYPPSIDLDEFTIHAAGGLVEEFTHAFDSSSNEQGMLTGTMGAAEEIGVATTPPSTAVTALGWKFDPLPSSGDPVTEPKEHKR